MLATMAATPINNYPISSMQEPMAFVIAILIFSYFFASIFISVFLLVVDTILFCYLLDPTKPKRE